MKKLAILASVACAFCVALLSGCAGQGANSANGKIRIVCANFPAYDWAREVVGERAADCDITYLMEKGVELHSYQPTVEDIAKISQADLFIYVGGESDAWAADAIKTAKNADLRTVNMMEVVGDAAVEEELVEGMQAEPEDEDEDHEEHEHATASGDDAEYDEHVWLSLSNAKKVVNAISDELGEIDGDHAKVYDEQAMAYDRKLTDLDNRYIDTRAHSAKDTLVFADRFPFRYLTTDYNLKYYAAFLGCSAETEASFETVTFLANKVDELDLSCVLTIEGSDQRIAKTVVESTKGKNQKILTMDSLQSVSADDVAAGKTYLSAMEDNLKVLAEALA